MARASQSPSRYSESPSDRWGGGMACLRSRSTSSTHTPHVLSKSPSVASVSSTHSVVEELSLNDFMLKYSKNLPLKVRVTKGFFGISEETAINNDDILKLHFMKHSKVVVMETSDHASLSIPFTSNLKFSLIYDPHSNHREAMTGFKFETVSDLLGVKGPLPRVVRATRAFSTPSPDACVAQDEMFIIHKQNKKSGKLLKVFSLTAGKKKTLHDSCAGHFTTAPEDIGINIADLAVHLPECMPCRAVLYVRGKECSGVLGDLHESVVTLKHTTTESSIIATSGDSESDTSDVYEMPADLDIEVEAIALDEYEQEALRGDTKYLYELFDPFSVTLYLSKSSKRLYDIQCELYKAVNTDLTGLEIMRPHAITLGTKSSAPVLTRTTSYPGSSPSTNNGGYQPLVPHRPPRDCTDYYVVMSPNRPSITEHDSDMSGDSTVSEHLSIITSHNRSVEEKLSRVVDELQTVRGEMGKLQTFTEHLRKFCESLQTQIRMMGSTGGGGGGGGRGVDSRGPAPLPGEENLLGVNLMRRESRSSSPGTTNSDVARLSHIQVLQLLDVMGMTQYSDVFQREKINGEVLVDMDEEMMKNDLGISAKLHRMRLMKVIKGEHSTVKQIFTGEAAYENTKKVESIYSIPRKQDSPTPQSASLPSSLGSE